MFSDKPDYIREIRSCSSVPDKSEHAGVLHFVHVQGQSPYCYPHHRFRMIEEFDGFSVQRKIVSVLQNRIKKNKTHYSVIYFIIEEVYGVSIQFQTERLEKRDVVSHDFLIRKIKFMHDDRIHMVIR
jgi:hypothetical protein